MAVCVCMQCNSISIVPIHACVQEQVCKKYPGIVPFDVGWNCITNTGIMMFFFSSAEVSYDTRPNGEALITR